MSKLGRTYDWTLLPQEIICYIFTFLSRRDKLAFTLVCPEWMYATDVPCFWKKLDIVVNQDFLEPSLIYLIQKYYKYITILKIGWSHPMAHKLGTQLRYKEMVKRVGRLFVLLFERLVQIQHLVIYTWYDIHHLKKLSFLLLRFVKYQCNLQSVTLINANLHDMNFTNILIGCLRSKSVVNKIILHYTTYNSRKLFDGWVFANTMELFYNLEVLVIDCWTFWELFNKLQVCFFRLKDLTLYLDESEKKIDCLPSIRENQWEMFTVYLPKTIVTLKIEKSISDDFFRSILQKYYPLSHFIWRYTHLTETCENDCNQCLERLAKLQCKTLENIRLYLPIGLWNLKNKINLIKRKCQKLKSFIINDVEFIESQHCWIFPITS